MDSKKKNKIEVDGYKVMEEFLLTKGEQVVNNGKIPFKPLIDFSLIFYQLKANATNRLSMKFDLEKFFMRKCTGELLGTDTKYVKVPTDLFNRVKIVNDQYRNGNLIEE